MKNILVQKNRNPLILLSGGERNIAKSFITSYQINGQDIKINYSDGKFSIFEYTKETEENVLKIMKRQAILMNKYREEFVEDAKRNNKSAKVLTFIALPAILLGCSVSIKKLIFPLAAIASICGDLALWNYADFVDYTKKVEEIDKYNFFLENEELINREILRGYFELCGDGADINEAPRLTINDIDIFSLKDLKNMVYLIKSSQGYKLEQKRA